MCIYCKLFACGSEPAFICKKRIPVPVSIRRYKGVDIMCDLTVDWVAWSNGVSYTPVTRALTKIRTKIRKRGFVSYLGIIFGDTPVELSSHILHKEHAQWYSGVA